MSETEDSMQSGIGHGKKDSTEQDGENSQIRNCKEYRNACPGRGEVNAGVTNQGMKCQSCELHKLLRSAV